VLTHLFHHLAREFGPPVEHRHHHPAQLEAVVHVRRLQPLNVAEDLAEALEG
jgi:hypothetical protein